MKTEPFLLPCSCSKNSCASSSEEFRNYVHPFLYHSIALLHHSKAWQVHPDLFLTTANMTNVKALCLDIQQNQHRHTPINHQEMDLIAHGIIYFLRESAEPLLTCRLYQRIVDLGNVTSSDDISFAELQKLVNQLPMEHCVNLSMIIGLLHEIVATAHVQKRFELAQVFGPLMCKHRNSAFMSIRHRASFRSSAFVIDAFTHHYEAVFRGMFCNANKNKKQKSSTHVERVSQLIHSHVSSFLKYGEPQPLILFDTCRDIKKRESKSETHSATGTDLHTAIWLMKESRSISMNPMDRPWISLSKSHREKITAACKRLHNKITQFYLNFEQRYGRTPASTSDRGSEMTFIITAYQLWDKLIRDNAVKTIQYSYRQCKKRYVQALDVEPARDSFRLQPTKLKNGPELLAQQKRDLKMKLKEFDSTFEAQHHRKPSIRDKEPIRELYEQYHHVKISMTQQHQSR